MDKFPLPESLSSIPDDQCLPALYPVEMYKSSDELFGRSTLAAALLRKDESTFSIFTNSSKVFDPLVDCGNMVKDALKNGHQEDPMLHVEHLTGREMEIPESYRTLVKGNKRLTPQNHWQDIREVCLRVFPVPISSSKLKKPASELVGPGSTIILYPKNSESDVQNLINLMDWEDVADQKVHFRSETTVSGELIGPPKGLHLPKSPYTLRELLTYSLDIMAIPKRSFFEQVWFFSNDESHRERLLEFTDPKLIDEFFDYTSRPRRTMIEVLDEFSSVKIPLEYVAAVFPPLRGRHYSISSLLKYPDGKMDVRLIIALVKYKTVLQKARQGLCSRYVENLGQGASIQVQVAGESWAIPKERRILAVATGTGLAPIRYLLEERNLRQGASPEAEYQKKDVLFYGCRHPKKDCLVTFTMRHQRANVRRAFSRKENQPKEYVQDLIRQHSKEVFEAFRSGCQVVICGSSGAMPKAVRQAFVDVVVKEGKAANEEEAQSYLARVPLVEETW